MFRQAPSDRRSERGDGAAATTAEYSSNARLSERNVEFARHPAMDALTARVSVWRRERAILRVEIAPAGRENFQSRELGHLCDNRGGIVISPT